MLLRDKSVIIYGGAGNVGSAIARAFAREGANLFLAGRTLPPLEEVAAQLGAQAAQVDVLNEEEVERHGDGVVARAGRIDISINAVSIRGEIQGTPLVDMATDDFAAPIETAARAHFITARYAARQMIPNGAGVILTLSSTAAGLSGRDRSFHRIGGFGVACTAVEALSRTFAGELGPHGVRVVCLRSDALPQTWPKDEDHQCVKDYMESGTALRRLPTLEEVAEAAVFAASDRASAITGAILNLTCGSIMDAD